MVEFVGAGDQVNLQKRLNDRQAWIAKTPGVANGGRLLHFVDPARVGWDTVCELAEEDGLVGFPAVEAAPTLTAIRTHQGEHWKTPTWLAFMGTPEKVLPACNAVITDVPIPDGWTVDAMTVPDEKLISEVQALNQETGVSPYPAYYIRSEAVPVLTVCISDDLGELIATASAAFRYHAESRLAGCVFAGMVSVSPTYRGRGLGKLANAFMLSKSHEVFGWTSAKEQVSPDNAASQAMIKACGLDNDAGLVSIGATNSGESFTR